MLRTFSGQDEFKALSSEILGAYRKLFPVVNKDGHEMQLSKIWLDDQELDPHDYTHQKKVKLNGGTWGVPLYASLTLKDPTGRVVDKLEKIRLATIPRITPRGSFIVKGKEYQVPNQMIRKPGAYVIKSEKGDTFKAQMALGVEGGMKNFDIELDPKTNKYKVDIGTATKPLYPLMKALGIPDSELEKAWGKEIFDANRKEKVEDYISYAKKLTGKDVKTPDEAKTKIMEFAAGTRVDPMVTKLTLGNPYTSLTGKLLLDTSAKMLHIYQGKAVADDPENLLFKEIRSVEDMLHDKLGSKAEQENLKRMLGRHLGRRTNLKQMINIHKLTSPVESFFINDNRTATPEQYNPVHMLSEKNKLTIHGTGGITSSHAVADVLREVHPSHLGFIDSLMTPESEKIGTTLHIAAGVVKDGRDLRTMVLNARNGKQEFLTPAQLHASTVAFPDEVDETGKFLHPQGVRIQKSGKLDTIASKDVDYILHSPQRLFSYATNLVPFLKNNQGNRTVMASKMLGQALPLIHRAAPLVQTAVEEKGGKTFQEVIGEEFCVRAPRDGTITEVTADHIKLNGRKIPLYNNFPLNAKTHLHHEVTVKVGDKVKAGQLIADSNFTKGGSLALGANLKVAYLPIPGLTFEDGIVITESAAKKLSAEQMYRHEFAIEPGKRELNFRRFLGLYLNQLNRDQLKAFDTEGVVKKGSVVQPGQILIAGMHYNLHSPENMTLRKLNKSLAMPWTSASVKYTGEFPGIVTDVIKRGDKVEVLVKAVEPARESDKLSGTHGNKGVITKVIADKDAPRNEHGEIPDVFLNPHGVVGRINLGQIYESAAGKLAHSQGKKYVVKNFAPGDTNVQLTAEMKKAGISDTEMLYTPAGKKLGEVHVGIPHILRLAKTGKSGFSARMPGQGYDQNQQPIRGGEEGAKSMDQLTFYAMLSHGAKKNLIDAHQKSERNDEYWRAIELGKPLPAPKASFAFEKFISMLKGAGVDVHREGNDVLLAPMTDKDVLKLSNGRIDNPQFLYGKNLQEIKKGFFDTTITGGLNGKRYAHLQLPEKLPNPVFESAIRALVGIKDEQYRDLLSGKLFVHKDGNIGSENKTGSITGGVAISHLLGQVDVDSDLTKSRALLRKAQQPSDIEKLNKKVRYLTALKELNMTPSQAYLRQMVPIIPPQFRPIQETTDRGLVVSAPNYLYQNLGILAKSHDYEVMKYLPEAEKGNLRDETYKASRALAGLEPVLTRGKDHPIEGFISQITGSSPKQGFFLKRLLTKRQDLVGRGVITAGPELGMDQLGIPEKMAWTIFQPFMVREFTAAGYKSDFARKEILGKTALAKRMLEQAMNKRTVLMNRAPSLHKFSIMAHKPVLSDSLAVKVPPLILKGMGGDFDGDAVNIHVPSSEEAVRESYRMLPSQNLFKPGTDELMTVPTQESQIGLYLLSQSAEGRKRLNALLPAKYHVIGELDKKASKHLYDRLAHELPKEFPQLVQNLKNLGDTNAYDKGFTTSMKDLQIDSRLRDAIFRKAEEHVAILKKGHAPGRELNEKIGAIYRDAGKAAYQHTKDGLKGSTNSFYQMVTSGARGNDQQLQQMLTAPGAVLDSKNNVVPIALKKSYAEGLNTSDYFVSSYGARKGMIDRALATSKPGALNKEIMASTVNNLITESDCGTHKGVSFATHDHLDLIGRYTSHDEGGVPRNTLVTPQILSALEKRGLKVLNVRSPLKCLSAKGTCGHCFGIDEHGQTPDIGENVGAKMGQTMTEPMTQFVMRCTISVVTVKYREKIYTRSLEDIFDIIEAPITLVDGRETKQPADEVLVQNRNGWSKVEFLQRHKPDVPIHFLKTKTGDAVLVQADHPIFRFDPIRCECEKKSLMSCKYDNKGYSAFECSHCRRVVVKKKREMSLSQTVIPVSEVKQETDALWVKRSEVDGTPAQICDIDPYIAGFYLAEGSTRGNERYDGAVAVLMSQYGTEIRDYAYKKCVAAGYNAKNNPQEVAIYDTKLAPRFAQLFPGYAHQKRMNFEFMHQEKKYLTSLISGLIDGDGTIVDGKGYGDRIKIYTSSFILMQQISMIYWKLGVSYSCSMASMKRAESADPRKAHKAQPYVIEIPMNATTAYLFKESIKVSGSSSISWDSKLGDMTTIGPSPVMINRPVFECKYEEYTYDLKTDTQSFMAGFIYNHNTIHTGGLAGSEQVSGFKRVSDLLSMQRNLSGEATLATAAGHVTKIEKSPAGGFKVHMGTVVHTISPGLPVTVKVGDKVLAGDALSKGVIDPRKLAAHKGMAAAQEYVANELQKAYKDQGVGMQRKVFETVLRSVANNTIVRNAPAHADFLPGDIIPFPVAEHYNETRKVNLPVDDTIGYHLMEATGPLKRFHEIRAQDIPRLKAAHGHGTIDVVKAPLEHTPLLSGIRQIPAFRKDWMAQLGFQHLEKALTEGAAQRWKSAIQGNNPVPAFAYGAEFGRKKESY